MNDVTGKIELFLEQFLQRSQHKLKTKSAAIAFFSSLPFFLLALSIFPFFVLFYDDFRAHFAFGFWSFSQSKDCIFRSVRFQKFSKIMIWLLRLPIHYFSLTYQHPQIYKFHFFEAFHFLVIKGELKRMGG